MATVSTKSSAPPGEEPEITLEADIPIAEAEPIGFADTSVDALEKPTTTTTTTTYTVPPSSYPGTSASVRTVEVIAPSNLAGGYQLLVNLGNEEVTVEVVSFLFSTNAYHFFWRSQSQTRNFN